MELVERIKLKVEEEIKDPGMFLVDTIVSGEHGTPAITIIIDGDDGVNVKNCAQINRSINDFLSSEKNIPENFSLTVSSPGLDHPLKIIRQYTKNIGRIVKVFLNQGNTIEGTLSEVNESRVLVRINDKKNNEKEIESIPFNDINKTLVMVSFKRGQNG